MKKFVLLFISSLLSVMMFAQSNVSWYDLYGSIVIKGGYNVLEKEPVAMMDIYADIGFLRAEIEVGCTYFSQHEGRIFTYFAPAIGVTYGNRNTLYFLVGGQPYGAFTLLRDPPKLRGDEWHFKIEGGVDIRLSDLLFINLSSLYLLPRSPTECTHYYDNLAFMAGLGFNF